MFQVKKTCFLQTSGAMPYLRSGEVWREISFARFKKRVARKLHRTTLVHCGLGTFGVHFVEARKTFIYMIFAPADVTMTSQTNHFQFLICQMIAKSARNNHKSFLEIAFLETSKSLHPKISRRTNGKDRSRHIPKIRLICFSNS